MSYIYKRKAQYHETDQMAVIHHSNYFRWLEEARVEFLKDLGTPYKEFEAKGIISPIVDVSAKYIKPITFEDTAYIYMDITKYNGVKLSIEYHITNQNDELCVIATTTSCFVKDNQVCSLKRVEKEFDEKFRKYIENEQGNSFKK